ncbi:alpha/beta-hydrolase [Ceratobasidium sp. AG-I]|nr:alpha/beta-hydrolase [Ceratobasidium sp. AG-I]
MLRTLRLKVSVFLIRSAIRLVFLFRRLFGTRPYAANFPPDRTFIIKSSRSSRKIRINVYEPNQFDKNGNYPVHINMHGSGFILPLFGSDADFCRVVSNRTGAIVLDCDYAKAPEWPFPAAPDDVKDIVDYALANQEAYFDTSRITIGGFSAGAALALTACVSQPKGTFKGVIAFYPPTDLSLHYTARRQPVVSPGAHNPLSPSFFKLVTECYQPPGTDLSDPRLSPINTPVSLFPEHILVVACGEDPLHDEGVAFANKIEAEGVKVVLRDVPNVVHGWEKEAKEGTSGGKARHDTFEAAVNFLKAIFDSPPRAGKGTA